MRIVIINKSDSTGGAAVVSRRLMEAFRTKGMDARMLVAEKLTDSPYVEQAAKGLRLKFPFLKERLAIYVENGFNRETLFKMDTATDGLPLWEHPLVKNADAILLNWVNQGFLSLDGVRKIAELGKPVIWTMHDMWNMTGICHHAGECNRYKGDCGECPLLGKRRGVHDLSYRTWKRKRHILPSGICYVAVSTWLAGKGQESSLLKDERVEVIPNAFPLKMSERLGRTRDGRIRMIFGAARVDDPIKGLPVLVEMTKVLKEEYPAAAKNLEVVTFGGVKNPESLSGMGLPHRHLGMLHGEENVRKVYEEADILISASSYETLPGTLVEAQAYGCLPVSFDQGGQRDIVEPLQTGFIASYSPHKQEAARRLAEEVVRAVEVISDKEKHREFIHRMRESVADRFSAQRVAEAYLDLISSLSPRLPGPQSHSRD